MQDFYQSYPRMFRDLLKQDYRIDNYIGQGNPNSKILIIGKECAIKKECNKDCSECNEEYREEKCKEDYKTFINNFKIWKTKSPENIQNWFEACSWDAYHPRYPFYGQLMLKDNNTKGQKKWDELNRGTSVTWKAIQEFINNLLPDDKKVLPRQMLNFFDYCFLTELSCNCMPKSEKNDITKASIENRIGTNGILSHPFFKSFPVIIFDIYHYIDWYSDLKILEKFGGVKSNGEPNYSYKGIIVSEEVYNQYDEKTKRRMPLYRVNNGFKKGEFINVHISKDGTQILLHTSHFVDNYHPRSDVWMKELADIVKPFVDNI